MGIDDENDKTSTNEGQDKTIGDRSADKLNNVSSRYLGGKKNDLSLMNDGGLSSTATTSVNFQNVENHTPFLAEGSKHGTYGTPSMRGLSNSGRAASVLSFDLDSTTRVPRLVESSYYDDGDGSNSEEELQDLFQNLIARGGQSKSLKKSSRESKGMRLIPDISDLDMGAYDSDSDFIKKRISLSKVDDPELFHTKLKHFFILSAAGKPIYSMNGSERLVIGYMGLITSIISSFQELIDEEIKSVTFNNIKVVILNKSPLFFVALTKIKHEFNTSEYGEEESILGRQLKALYNYLVSILSKSSITRSFRNRMNYDLRKVLSPLDFHNFDSFCMKLTYGFYSDEEDNQVDLDFSFFASRLLSSFECCRMRNKTRTRINGILQDSKKIKKDIPKEDDNSSYFFKSETSSQLYLAPDMLFALITSPEMQIISYLHPKNHRLSTNDISVLLSMITSIHETRKSSSVAEDSWVPLCLPDFNSTGFVHIFLKVIDLSKYVAVDGIEIPYTPITIALISGNKNSFFEIQEISKYIIDRVTGSELLRNELANELTKSKSLSISQDLSIPSIKHFMFKLKQSNQFITSDAKDFTGSIDKSVIMNLVYFYSHLFHSRTDGKLSALSSNRRLNYYHWALPDNSVIGFMLIHSDYEYYCLCDGDISSLDIIANSLNIIRWCQKYKKRLFIDDGVTF